MKIKNTVFSYIKFLNIHRKEKLTRTYMYFSDIYIC